MWCVVCLLASGCTPEANTPHNLTRFAAIFSRLFDVCMVLELGSRLVRWRLVERPSGFWEERRRREPNSRWAGRVPSSTM